jgi:hypothetical protein
MPRKKARLGSVKLKDYAPSVPEVDNPFEQARTLKRNREAQAAEESQRAKKAKRDEDERFSKVLTETLFGDESVPVPSLPSTRDRQQHNFTVAEKIHILDYFHKKHNDAPVVDTGQDQDPVAAEGALAVDAKQDKNPTRSKRGTTQWVRAFYKRPKFARTSLQLMLDNEARIREATGTRTKRRSITRPANAVYPQMDSDLANWVRETRRLGIPVETYMLADEGRQILTRLYPNNLAAAKFQFSET